MTINTARRLMRTDITDMPLEKLQRHKVRLLDAWREATGECYGFEQAVRDGFMVDATTHSMSGYRPADCWLVHNLKSAYERASEKEKILLNETKGVFKMKTKANKWLRGNEAHILITNGKGKNKEKGFIEFMRVSVREELDAIYYRHDYFSATPDLREKFEYGGVYDRRDKLLYDLPYGIKTLKLFDDTAEERSASVVADTAQKRIREIVDAALDNNRDNLRIKTIEEVTDESAMSSYNGHIKHHVPRVARKMFLEGNTPEDIQVRCNYNNADLPATDMLDWIIDAEAYCQCKAAEYLDANQERLFTRFLENDATKAELQKIIDDPNHGAHSVKAIISALDSRNCQTVMVTVIIDGKELTFCTKASDLRRDPEGSYSTWHITAPDRVKFEELFGKNENYRPEHITKITYSRVVLYERSKE